MDSLILGLRVLVALGAVLGLMWILQRRLLKGKGKGRGRRRASTTLTVVSRQTVGQKASVVVVDAGDKRFLLGVTEHAINVLHSSEIPAEVQETPVPEGTTSEARLPVLARRPRDPRADVPVEAGTVHLSFEDIFRGTGETLTEGWAPEATEITRRSGVHRRNQPHNQPEPLHGSILAGSTWRQAAEAIRGRRN